MNRFSQLSSRTQAQLSETLDSNTLSWLSGTLGSDSSAFDEDALRASSLDGSSTNTIIPWEPVLGPQSGIYNPIEPLGTPIEAVKAYHLRQEYAFVFVAIGEESEEGGSNVPLSLDGGETN